MSRVVVFGANGQIGRLLVGRLAGRGYVPVAVVRKPEQQERVAGESVLASLDGTVDELAGVVRGAHAVVFTAGSGGATGDDRTLEIDLDGCVKAMEALVAAGVRRFVMVSTIGAHNRDFWYGIEVRPEYACKHYAERILKLEFGTRLDYTIVQPPWLTNEPGTGNGVEVFPDNYQIELREDDDPLTPRMDLTISREDLAAYIAAIVDDASTFGRTIQITGK